MDILIVIEDNNSKIHRMGLESIAAAQSISKDKGFSIGVLVMGGNAEGLATEVSKYDVFQMIITNSSFNKYIIIAMLVVRLVENAKMHG